MFLVDEKEMKQKREKVLKEKSASDHEKLVLKD